jgi:HSP20 family protein
MIIVNLKPNPFHQNTYLSENLYLNAGIVNWRMNMRPHLWRPSTDVFETEDRFVTRVEIAGMNEADFQVNIDQNILTISGTRPDTGEHRAFHQMEIHFGDFISQVEFPNNIERDKVEAEYKDGFLTVILPKAPPTQIKISKE